MNSSGRSRQTAALLAGAAARAGDLLRRMRPRLTGTTGGRAFTALLVAALFLAGALIRIHHFERLTAFDPADDTAFFWTESAFQYRYAKMAGEGRSIPAFDPLVQYPDGLRVWEQETPVMEYLDGALYRIFGAGTPFHVFLVFAICFTSSLGVIAAYGAAASLWEDRRAGLLAAALYAVAMASFSRILGTYGREHLSLPFFFFGLWGLAAAMGPRTGGGLRRSPRAPALASGAAMGALLASWHLGRFLFLILAVCLAAVWVYLLFTDEEESDRLAWSAGWMLLPVLAAILLSPLLRSQQHYLSPGAVLPASLFLASLAGRSLPPARRLGLWLLVLLPLLGAAAVVTTGAEEAYSHVRALLQAKAAHGGIKPADPAVLPFEARLMWIEDFHSPSPRIALYAFGTIPLLAGLGAVIGVRHRAAPGRRGGLLLWLLLTVAYAALFLLMQRMIGFLVFFLVVLAAGTLASRRAVLLLAVLACLGFEAHKFVLHGQPTAFTTLVNGLFPPRDPAVPNWRQNDLSLFAWIRRHTGPDEAILATYGASPAILAYAGRPIVIQSKIENRAARERIRAFLDALYGPEEAFHQYCRDYGVRYFLFEAPSALDAGRDGDRFTAGHLRLRRDAAAYLFQFHPERLKNFTLLFQNSFYRVYAVASPGGGPGPRLPYQPTYDVALYGPQEGAFFDDRGTAAVMARLDRAVQLYVMAQAYLRAGRAREAAAVLRSAQEHHPGLQGLHADLGLALFRLGRLEDALVHLREETDSHPDFVPGYYMLGQALASAGRDAEALRAWSAGLLRDPDNEALRRAIAVVQGRGR